MRRFVLVLAAFALLAPPSLVSAQTGPRPIRVGTLSIESCPDAESPFTKAMAKFGWVFGRDFDYECVLARGRMERLPELAEELVARRVDIIVTGTSRTVGAVQRATRTIPIVMVGSFDAVREGLVASLARPGGNVTGLTDASNNEMIAKRVESLVETLPRLKRLAVLRQSSGSTAEGRARFAGDVAEALRPLGVGVQFVDAGNAGEIAAAFEALGRDPPDAVYVVESPLFVVEEAETVARSALRHRLPTIGGSVRQARAGLLFTYSARVDDRFQLAAGYVDRILKGAKPADLPVQQPTKFELVVNLKTAKALGITVPQSILARADEVIE